MKKLKHITSWFIWSLIALYAIFMIGINIPVGQRFMGEQLSGFLSRKLGTQVAINRIELGYLNRLTLDNITLFDQQGKEMLKAGRLSVKMNPFSLLEGHVHISSAQLFGAHIQLYKTDSLSKPNYQFVIDSLSSDSESESNLDIKIKSLIIRHSSIRYDQYDIQHTPNILNSDHLYISDISAHVNINDIQKELTNIHIKRLAFKEQSGLNVNRLSLNFHAEEHQAQLTDFFLKMPQSTFSVDSLSATFDKENLKNSLQFRGSISESTLCPADISCLTPQLKYFDQPLLINTRFSGTSKHLTLPNLTLATDNDDLSIKAKGWISNTHNHLEGELQQLEFNIAPHIMTQIQKAVPQWPNELNKLGRIRLLGKASLTHIGALTAEGTLETALGNAEIQLSRNDRKQYTSHIYTKSFNLGEFLNIQSLGRLGAQINLNGTPDHFTADGTLSHLEYNLYCYKNITLNADISKKQFAGKIKISDSNIDSEIQGELLNGKRSTIKLTGYINHLAPQRLNLTNRWGDVKLSGSFDADFLASNINDAEGSIHLNNFEMMGSDSISRYYQLNHLEAQSGFEDSIHYLRIKGDMGEASISGNFDWQTLPQSFINYIASKLPTLPGLPETTSASNNNFTITLMLTDADWLQKFMNIPVSFERPLTLHANVDDTQRHINIHGQLPKFTYNGSRYNGSSIHLTTDNDTLKYHLVTTKVMDNDGTMDLSLKGVAANNQITSSLQWNQFNMLEPEKTINGTINTTTQLYTNSHNEAEAQIRILPSEMMIQGKPWNINPCDIIYSPEHLLVDHFSVNHGSQHLTIDGDVSADSHDTLNIDLNDVEVAYVLDLVNFHAVSFEGLASGTIKASQLFGDFEAAADLTVHQFRFQSGDLGTLTAHANWNHELQQIDIDAIAEEGLHEQTLIQGYVSPVRNDINLDIHAMGTNIAFCQSFTSSFLNNVKGRAHGNVVLGGSLKALELTGELLIDGEATVTALNTTYQLKQDVVRLTPGEILFNECMIEDKWGHQATVTGALHHDHLSDFTFDFDIRANNLLAYDFPDFNGDIICGTVYVTGKAELHGRPGEVVINCFATPQPKSTFSYNATNPDAISKQEFIVWNTPSQTLAEHRNKQALPSALSSATDLYINFNIDATPDATLKVLMDNQTNDYITLNGTGNIKATYHNKGPFNMYGTYTVNRGTYGITIQNIIKKNFVFQNGGNIVFGGDPFDANLNLQAQYTVNGVSLSDLNLGNTFGSNTVRVNCLMNIIGSPGSPHVEFDFELPTVNAEENQMIRSVITSEQEMNQQVLYLLGIGRFYTQGANNAQSQEYDQTQLAMQSFLSGTVSSQINELLSQIISSNDWNFGANISTGNEGWHNAEYEGLVSGRMLNNRLLINGQFGYRDNATQSSPSFIGDFDIQYLLKANGNLAIKVYNQTNDRYFTRSSLNTQGVGLIMKKDFKSLSELFHLQRKSTADTTK